MAFKMKGFPLRSGFKQITEEEKIEIAKNQDPGSGRNKADEIHFDIMESFDEEKRLQEEYDSLKINDPQRWAEKYRAYIVNDDGKKVISPKGNPTINPMWNVSRGRKLNIKAWENLTGETFEFPK